MTGTDKLIMEMSETELRAVLLQLAGGARGRDAQDATAAEIGAVLALTRATPGNLGARRRARPTYRATLL